MSVLVFHHTDEGATILTDTLVVTGDSELRPVRFGSKVWIVPHLNLVIGGRGILNLFEAWDRAVSELLCRDVVMLDEAAPGLLRGIWGELLQQPDADQAWSSTVYHLGFEDGTGRCVGYKYVSGSDFESEPLAPALRVAPAPEAPIQGLPTAGAPLDDVVTLEGMVAVVNQLREEHRAKPLNARCCIGGHLMLTVLADGMIMTRRLAPFDDFEEHWASMLELHEAQWADALANAGP